MQTVRLLLLAMILTVSTSGMASAVTLDELAGLAKAGLGDEVLLALIESTGVDGAVDAARSLALKRAGVSDRVIAAAVRASHWEAQAPILDAPAAAARCVECEANVAVIGAPAPVAVVQREVYYLPWIWALPARHGHSRPSGPYLAGHKGFGRFINDGFVDRTTGSR